MFFPQALFCERVFHVRSTALVTTLPGLSESVTLATKHSERAKRNRIKRQKHTLVKMVRKQRNSFKFKGATLRQNNIIPHYLAVL